MSAQILFILMTNPSHGDLEILGFNAIRLPLLQLGFAVQGLSLLPLHSDRPYRSAPNLLCPGTIVYGFMS